MLTRWTAAASRRTHAGGAAGTRGPGLSGRDGADDVADDARAPAEHNVDRGPRVRRSSNAWRPSHEHDPTNGGSRMPKSKPGAESNGTRRRKASGIASREAIARA